MVSIIQLADELNIDRSGLRKKAIRLGLKLEKQPCRTENGPIQDVLFLSKEDADKIRQRVAAADKNSGHDNCEAMRKTLLDRFAAVIGTMDESKLRGLAALMGITLD